ncbi:MAG: hypothetical protein ACRDIB_13810, partial [Ardenticatenaceae bacterium]
MLNQDAQERFRGAAMAFSKIDQKLRDSGPYSVEPDELKEVSIDLDAAIPGLNGVMLGRALVLKGDVLF